MTNSEVISGTEFRREVMSGVTCVLLIKTLTFPSSLIKVTCAQVLTAIEESVILIVSLPVLKINSPDVVPNAAEKTSFPEPVTYKEELACHTDGFIQNCTV